MASSSSINSSYDVFLSFRGTDTRNNFTSHLHKALCDNNVKAFIDNSIDRGKEIISFLDGIIDGIKLSIIVFSSDYASSTFCLNEMVRIMKCEETKAQIVVPIFYKVYPSENMYDEAFARHEQASKKEIMMRSMKSIFRKALKVETDEQIISNKIKVDEWRSYFQKALKLAGWPIDDNSNEATVIEEITKDVLKKLYCQFEGEMKSTPLVGETSENYLEKVMQCLMNAENPKVGVWGMGGVGKTTIVTHVNNILLNDASFSRHIYWVTVSRDSSISKLQGEIAKQIKLDLSGIDNESKRAAKLFKELKRINKFVLILDDVWEPFETEDIGIPLSDGQKLLLTTRDLGVCQRMMCQWIEVKPLSEHEAVDLFMKESRIQINDSREWREIVHSIVKECAALPLAIVVVARTMRGIVEIRKWRNTLRELHKPGEGENHEVKDKVFKILKFSYDRLPNNRHRQCFLYCSLFPEDHTFKGDDLINYWIGMGIIDELDSRQAELDRGNAILDELIQSSLLEETTFSSFRKIKMHDVIRDMALINVKVGLEFQDPLESVQVYEKMLNSFSNSVPRYSNLKTLALRDDCVQELSRCFFADMQSLNVLHMTSMKSLESIPDSISNLGNIKVLIINGCGSLECIPSLIGLEKLQHLEISSNHSLKEMPKGIERLVNLKVLDLSWNQSLSGSFPSSVVENLSHLQTLNLISSRVEVELEALVSLEKLEILMVDFYSLNKLNCYVKSEHWRRLVDYQINYGTNKFTNRKGMSFHANGDFEEWIGKSGIYLPEEIQNLKLVEWESPMLKTLKNSTFLHLQTIHINKCKSRYLFTVDLAQHLLHNVQELLIVECSGLEEIIATEEEWVNQSNYPTIILPNLKILRLMVLPSLRSIYRGRIVCSSLELITGAICYNLERLPFCMEKEGKKQNITIGLLHIGRENSILGKWWNSLQWDDPNDKAMYSSNFQT